MQPRSTIAWFCALTHVAACVVLLLFLRNGLPPNAVELRQLHMRESPVAWEWSWYVWHAAGLSFVALCIVLARRLRAPLGAILAIVAAVFDIHSEQLYIHELPRLDGAAFDRLDRWLDIENAGIANALYTAAMAWLLWRGRREMPRIATGAGVVSVIGGVLLSIGGFAHSGMLEIAAGAILFPFFVAWCIVVARWLRSG